MTASRTEFVVDIEKPAAGSLGLTLELDDGYSGHVCHIGPGPVQDYNSTAKPGECIEVGDYIVGVNGAENDAKQMYQEIQTSSALKLIVKHPEERKVVIGNGGNLGLSLTYAPTGVSLLIREINEGKIKDWNESSKREGNPDLVVMPNDRIVQVNQTRAGDTVRELLEELKQGGKDTQLEIVVSSRRPGPQGGEGPEEVAISPDDVSQLMDMGFSSHESQNALLANGGNLEKALESLTAARAEGEPEEEGGEEGGPAEEEGNDANDDDVKNEEEGDDVNNEDVAQLVEMGFPADKATAALKDAGGDKDRAIAALSEGDADT